MKLKLLVLLFIGILATPLMATGVEVVITIQQPSVSIIGATSFPVSIAPNSEIILASPVQVQNNGNVTENLTISGTLPNGWLFTNTSPTGSGGKLRVETIWHSATVPIASEFQSNDSLTTSAQTSSSSVFFDDSDTTSQATNGGTAVPVSGTRNLFVKVETGSSFGSPTLTLNINAVAP